MSYHFGVVEWFGGANQATIDLEVGTTDEYLRVICVPQFAQGLQASTMLNSTGSYLGTVGGVYNSQLTLTSSSPQVHDLSDAQAEQQYLALKQICADGTFAKCSFDPTSEVSTLADPVLAGPVVPNHANTTVDDEYTWKNTTETTSEWGNEADLSAGIEGIVEASVKASYGQSYSNSVTTGGTVTLPIDPGYTGWMTFQAPIERVTGDFTISVGNDTWNLHHVYFDLPKANDGSGGKFTPTTAPTGDPSIPSGVTSRKH